jgi:hypothetical protein
MCFFTLTVHAQQEGMGERGNRVAATGEAGLTATINQPSPAIGCGQPVTLTATITGATEISWKRNGEFINGATTNTFIANQPGIYQVVAISLLCQVESAPVEVILESPLMATIVAPSGSAACEGNSVQLQATGGIAQWQWYRNGVALNDGTSEFYDASLPGDYVVVGNEEAVCASTSQPMQVVIHPLPVVQLTWAGAAEICPGDSAIVLSTISEQEQVEWYHEESMISVGNNELTATLAGEYHALITNTTTGCSNWSNTLNLTVFPIQSIVVTALTPPVFCEGESATLAANTISGVLSWYENNLLLAGITDATLTIYSGGNFSARITDVNGCTAISNEVLIESLPLPDASMEFDASNPILCGAEDTLVVYTSTGNSYAWYSQTELMTGAETSELAITEPGSYSVQVIGANGCVANSNPLEIASFDAPVVTLEPNGSVNLCEGQVQLLEAFTSSQGQLHWYMNGTWIEGVVDGFLETSEQGSYQVAIIDDNGCEAFSETAFMDVIVVNTPIIIDGGITAEGQLLLTDEAAGHQWYLNGEMIPGATGADFLATEDGVYSVILIEDVCESEVSDGFEVVLGGVNEDELNIVLFPNPCNERITVRHQELQGKLVSIYDVSGRLVWATRADKSSFQVDTGSFREGLYQIHMGSIYKAFFMVVR